MTFRSDADALAYRVEDLERELAATEGRRRGTCVVVAELEERLRAADAKRLRVQRWRARRRVVLLVVGTAVGLAVGLTCSGLAVPIVVGVSRGRPVGAHLAGSASIDARDETCSVDVRGYTARECSADVRCAGRRVYRGRGRCSLDDEGRVAYWDHAPASRDGTTYCVVAEDHHVAVVGGPVPVRLALEAASR